VPDRSRPFVLPYQPFPKGSSGRPAHRPFRGLLAVHSRYGLQTRAVTVFRDTLSEGFSHFVTSIAAPVASCWSGCRVGLAPTGKDRLVTAHTQFGHHQCALSIGCADHEPLWVPETQTRIRAKFGSLQNCLLFSYSGTLLMFRIGKNAPSEASKPFREIFAHAIHVRPRFAPQDWLCQKGA
jgi:hypothetical protein